MRCDFATVVAILCLASAQPALADDVAADIEAARSAYLKGDQLHSLTALQAAVSGLSSHLVAQCSKFLPPPPAGWEGAGTDSQSLDTIGGGLTVTRGYVKGEATLNASLVIDNPAVGASLTMFQAASQVASQPGWSRIKVGNDDALLRYDSASQSGEIMMVIGDRVLLQIEGTEIASDSILVDAAKGWNTGGIRKFIGIGS